VGTPRYNAHEAKYVYKYIYLEDFQAVISVERSEKGEKEQKQQHNNNNFFFYFTVHCFYRLLIISFEIEDRFLMDHCFFVCVVVCVNIYSLCEPIQ
jgi:hypothetical protein